MHRAEKRLHCSVWFACLLMAAFCGAGFVPSSPVWAEDSETEVDPLEAELEKLIEGLGSPSYATRVRCREKLERMGLAAFDALHDAQNHVDHEIVMAAHQLVSSLSVSWAKDTDPPEVRAALDEYGSLSDDDRSSRIAMLAEFKDRVGLTALVRVARYERQPWLSRSAALAVMQQPMSDDEALRKKRAEGVREILGTNRRQASQWLRVYASDLALGGYSAAEWKELIQSQRKQIDSGSAQETTRPSVLELVRICAVRAAETGQHTAAMTLAQNNIDLIPPTTRDLIDASNWSIDNDLHPFVLELKKHHQRMFRRHPELLYGAAEAAKVGGDGQRADELAKQATSVNPLPTDETQRESMSPKRLEEAADAHREIGQKLQERGLLSWAEREYRLVIDTMGIDSTPGASARNNLAVMLGELERYEEAVEVLEPLVDRITKDDKFKARLAEILYPYGNVQSRQAYYIGLLKVKQGETEAAKSELQKAFRINPRNIDILIEMYRLESDDDWNKTVRSTLRRAIQSSKLEVKSAEFQYRQAGADERSTRELAGRLNQYAWLVSNTEGDYQLALAYSKRSLELYTDAAKLDTCARCYFAVGDFENAVLMQRRALKMEPHSPPMKRQLAQFKASLDKQNAEQESALNNDSP